MVSEVVPDGDVTKNWQSTAADHYTEIDEAHTAPDDTDYISCVGAAQDNLVDRFNMSTDAIGAATIDSVQVYIYAYAVGGSPEVDINLSGAWEGYHDDFGVGAKNWYSSTWDVSGLGYGQGELNNLSIRIRSDCAGALFFNYVYTMYAVITLSGWSTGDFSGVANANIDSISGVSKSDISDVKGV